MGILDKLFGRSSSEEKSSSKEISQPQLYNSNSDLVRDLTQEAALCIYSMKITQQPILRFFKEGWGIAEGVIISHLNDPNVKMIKQQYGEDMYLSLLGCHALGAGGYVTLCQSRFKKSVSEFTQEESMKIRDAFLETDPYELFLNAMHISPDSGNKRCMDRIVQVCVGKAKELLGDDVCKDDNLADLMRVLYNAGITVVMR